ncbi:MAG: hypothetical protein CMI02_17530 [Oceanospirillaceae bacterium]|nr:hypothetical protein [Oceanospirillaceae bacterium]|tara:strand:- start:30285 stop:30617 length:333 start_codon:yes stop_codon:yes gene_type:complete
MKKHRSKRELREQLDQEVRDFLDHGGEVRQVDRGESGLVDGRYNDRSLGFEKPRESRTPLADVLKTLELRKEQRRQTGKKPASGNRPKQPRKKIIYDDFGEPLRVIWEDD